MAFVYSLFSHDHLHGSVYSWGLALLFATSKTYQIGLSVTMYGIRPCLTLHSLHGWRRWLRGIILWWLRGTCDGGSAAPADGGSAASATTMSS